MLLLLLSVLVFTQTCLATIKNAQVCDAVQNENRFDCFPEQNANQNECIKRGCCWTPPVKNTKYSYRLDIPYCYYPSNFPNYQVVNKLKPNDGSLVYSLEKKNATFRPNEILKLEARIIPDSKQRLRVQILDPNNQRYQVPITNDKFFKRQKSDLDFDFQIYVSDKPFFIRIYRKSTGRLM